MRGGIPLYDEVGVNCKMGTAIQPMYHICLNKYQINMGFLHFHEIVNLSGVNILALWKDVVSSMGKLQSFDIDFLLPANDDFGRWKHLFDILFVTHLKNMYLKT